MAAAEFLWPTNEEDLPFFDLSDASPDEIGQLAEQVAFKLCDQDPLAVVQNPAVGEQLAGLLRAFGGVEAPRRRQLLDALCSGLTCLTAWVDRLLAAEPGAASPEAAAAHRGALRAYVFYLCWFCGAAGREAAAAAASDASSGAAAAAAAAAPRGRGGKKKPAAAAAADWDWPGPSAAKATAALGRALDADLWSLFRPGRPDEALLVRACQAAAAALELPGVARDAELAAGAAHVLGAAALRYGQLEPVASGLVDALNRHEHAPPVVAELLRYSVATWDDGRLAAAVLGEIAAVDPADYERQQAAAGEKAGVRSVAAFVEEVAARLPRVTAAQMALLLPHLGGRAHTLRSAIVMAIAHVLRRAFEPTPGEALDAAGVAARLRSKQHLLDVLCERVRDTSSYARKAVLQAWQLLAEARAVPLGHWQAVTEMAVGRLEDKSSLVRKEALRLLRALMTLNPFGPALPIDRFRASLALHADMLARLAPPRREDDADAVGAPLAVVPEGGSEAGDGAGDEAAPAVKDEPADEAVGAPPAEPAEPPARPAYADPATVGWDGSVEELQALVASLELAVDFAAALAGAVPTLTQLLASSTVTDVQESVALLLACRQFGVEGAGGAARAMLPLVFSGEPAIRDRIVDALDAQYVGGPPGAPLPAAGAARALVALAAGGSLGELGALEELLKQLIARGALPPAVVDELWAAADAAHAGAQAGAPGAARDLGAALALLGMVAGAAPGGFEARHVEALLRCGFAGRPDAPAARAALGALAALAPRVRAGDFGAPLARRAHAAAAGVLLAPPGALPDGAWFSAAEAAVRAAYALHPAPEAFAAAALRRLAAAAGGAAGDASRLSRFLFVLGAVALQHLVHVEACAKAVRQRRADAEKAAAEARAGAKAAAPGAEDINAELGVGSAVADAELDALKEHAEAQVLSARCLLGPYAGMVSALCHSRALLSAPRHLRGAALLALCKMAAVDAAFCEANVQLLFTLLQARGVEPALRCNIVVAVGDLALRWPNLLEPWTDSVYRPLGDPDAGVRKTSLLVLSHLVLNDMVKVKGNVARLALCLEDGEPRVASLARLFFHELSKREFKGASPIYNLLPDIISSLSSPAVPRPTFEAVMQHLLGFIKRDKQGDALADKLCQRFGTTDEPPQWRSIAFCLGQLPTSDKGAKKLADSFKAYKHALSDAETAEAMLAIATRARKRATKPEAKALAAEWEARIAAEAPSIAGAAGEAGEGDERAAAAAGDDQSMAADDGAEGSAMEEESQAPAPAPPPSARRARAKKAAAPAAAAPAPARRATRGKARAAAVVDSDSDGGNDTIGAIKMETD